MLPLPTVLLVAPTITFPSCAPQVDGVLHVHLPDGPTAHYKITNVVLGKEIKVCECGHTLSVSG